MYDLQLWDGSTPISPDKVIKNKTRPSRVFEFSWYHAAGTRSRNPFSGLAHLDLRNCQMYDYDTLTFETHCSQRMVNLQNFVTVKILLQIKI